VDDRWEWIEATASRQLEQRLVLVDPREVVDLKKDLTVRVAVLDVRSEPDFNRFHVAGARRMSLDDARDPTFVGGLLAASDNTVVFLVSNGEADAQAAWKLLKAQGVLNLYVVEGGINGWLAHYPPPHCVATRAERDDGTEALAWRFEVAVGDGIFAAHPDRARKDAVPPCAASAGGVHEPESGPPYVRRVELQRKVAAKGGCG
jgi:rhodanese-related sulfurtransferase